MRRVIVRYTVKETRHSALHRQSVTTLGHYRRPDNVAALVSHLTGEGRPLHHWHRDHHRRR